MHEHSFTSAAPDDEMVTFVHHCPTKGMNGQGWFANDPSANEREVHDTVTCLACTRVPRPLPVARAGASLTGRPFHLVVRHAASARRVAANRAAPELPRAARRQRCHRHQPPKPAGGRRAPVQRTGQHQRGSVCFITVSRYLVAHSPTERAALQTTDIARRLMCGGELRQEAIF
jgi:hypothetical protein